MDGSARLSVRQILGGFCLGFGLAAYLFGALAFIWLSHTFIIGYSSPVAFVAVALMPGLLMLIGIFSIMKSRKNA